MNQVNNARLGMVFLLPEYSDSYLIPWNHPFYKESKAINPGKSATPEDQLFNLEFQNLSLKL
jgi:hypothetical protein